MDLSKIISLYPEYTKVLGPYTRKDGRKHIVLNNENKSSKEKGKTKTISYPKALMEISLGRRLLKDETVDHRDRDFTNDDLNNLAVLRKSEHSALDALRVKVEDVMCVQCNKVFEPSVTQRNEKNAAGPFCSRRCSGKYGAAIQNGMGKMNRVPVKKSYFRKIKK